MDFDEMKDSFTDEELRQSYGLPNMPSATRQTMWECNQTHTARSAWTALCTIICSS